MMHLFLDHVSTVFADSFLVMQVDRAGWHTAHARKIPENIRLIPQPPYSPQLNPVAHIWEDVREKWFHNRVFPSLRKVVDTLAAGLQHLAMLPELVCSMTYFPHFRVLC
jgi:transposase